MSLPTISATLLALVFVQTSAQLRTPNFYKHLSHTGKDLVVSYKVGDSVSLSYAVCDRYSHNSSARSCALTLETVSPEGASHQKTCAVQLPRTKLTEPDYRKYKLLQIGGDEVLFVWKQTEGKKRRTRQRRSYLQQMNYFREFLKLNVIRMSSCETREVGVTAEDRDVYKGDERRVSNLNVMAYGNGSFAAFFRNHKFCGDKERCRVTYDASTRSFNASDGPSLPVPYHASAEMYPITSANSTVRGYVVAANFLEDGSVKLTSPEGQVLYDHVYSWSMFDPALRVSNIAVSYAHESFGVCQQGMFQSTIDCSLFGYNGKAKIGISVSLKSADVAVMKMRNAADGGFWILVGYAVDRSAAVFERFDVLRINSDGTMGKIREMRNVACPLKNSNVDVDFFEKQGSHYCYYMACTWPRSETEDANEFNLQFNSQCYPNENEIDDE